ncbi:MAG: exodeoxyribonuclease VII small subunit [Prevotellaceae bacterium]|jgi:exodeoxyribonuclease VII small subunit|nr:exodeoxyribonuclease VII small subunit [Prevotellaceae bacterium]
MNKKEKSYCEALSEIEEIINRLERGDIDIDEISKEVKLASELIKLCKLKLHATEEELNNILDNKED